MTQVIVDGALLARLNGLKERTEFRDEKGQVLGHFVPAASQAPALFVPPPEDRYPRSPEELDRRLREEGGRPLREIWKSLGVE